MTPASILVIGANGGIGRQAVEAALTAGYHVTALLRNPAKLTLTHPDLKIVQGDVMDPASLTPHLKGKAAIISALGTNTRKPTNLYSQGNANLLQEMQKAGVQRIFFISASGIEVSPVQPPFIRWVTANLLQPFLKNMYADIRLMEQRVKEFTEQRAREFTPDWTIMRPPRLTDHPATGEYRIAINHFLPRCLSISRADVAHFMIHNLNNEQTYWSTIEIAY